MKLRGIDFGTIQNASGARGFFGETASFNWPANGEPSNWQGSTFVSKTATLCPHRGNLKVAPDKITTLEKEPACIIVNNESKFALNAVGLTGPGIKTLLTQNKWQKWPDPFFISVMAISPTKRDRLEETKELTQILLDDKRNFASPFGLQVNFSCPNTSLHLDDLIEEIEECLAIYQQLRVPLVPKLNVLISPEKLSTIANFAHCDAVCISNTLPWGNLPDRVDWKYLFKSSISPLEEMGGGGLSGTPLFNVLVEYLAKLQDLNLGIPIIAGGGISSLSDAKHLLELGAAAISLGSVSMYAPEEVEKIIHFF